MDNTLKATPEKEDFGKKYKDESKISRKLIDNYFRSVKKLIDIAVSDSKINKALEIGCGEGYSTQRLKDLLPETTQLYASEFVANLVPVAQNNNPGVNIIQEDVYELQRKDNEFNLVFLLEVLEHLDYPDKALAGIKRISSDYLILGVPREPIWRILNMARGKYLSDFGNTTGHLNHWSSHGVFKVVEQNFGKVIAVEKPLPWTLVLAKNK